MISDVTLAPSYHIMMMCKRTLGRCISSAGCQAKCKKESIETLACKECDINDVPSTRLFPVGTVWIPVG